MIVHSHEALVAGMMSISFSTVHTFDANDFFAAEKVFTYSTMPKMISDK